MSRLIETENHVKDLVRQWYDKQGAWHYAPIQNGLGVHGIHDRIGCVPITVTPEMVGKTVGLFVSVEAKKPGRRNEENRGLSRHQYNNLTAILEAHGVSKVCDSEEDLQVLHAMIEGIRHG